MVFTSSYLIWCHIHNKPQIFTCVWVYMYVYTHTHIQTHTYLVFLICFLYEIWRSLSGVAESYWQFHLATPGNYFGNLSQEIDVLVMHKTVISSDWKPFCVGRVIEVWKKVINAHECVRYHIKWVKINYHIWTTVLFCIMLLVYISKSH